MKFANIKRNKADVVHELYVLQKRWDSLFVTSREANARIHLRIFVLKTTTNYVTHNE